MIEEDSDKPNLEHGQPSRLMDPISHVVLENEQTKEKKTEKDWRQVGHGE